MGRIADFFSKIKNRLFQKRLAEGKSVTQKEVDEAKNDLASAGADAKEVSELDKMLRETANLSPISPNRFPTKEDLYIGVMEDLGLSEQFKKNPEAKENLIAISSDVLRENLDIDIEDMSYNDFTQELSEKIKAIFEKTFKIEPGKLTYNKNEEITPGNGKVYEDGKTTNMIMDENGNYRKEFVVVSDSFDTKEPDVIQEKGSTFVRVFDKNGIETVRSSAEYVSEHNNAKSVEEAFMWAKTFSSENNRNVKYIQENAKTYGGNASKVTREGVNKAIYQYRDFSEENSKTRSTTAVVTGPEIANLEISDLQVLALKQNNRENLERLEIMTKEDLEGPDSKNLLNAQIKKSKRKEGLTQIAIDKGLMENEAVK